MLKLAGTATTQQPICQRRIESREGGRQDEACLMEGRRRPPGLSYRWFEVADLRTYS